MPAARIVVKALAGQILQPLQTSGRIKNQLRNAAVQVFSAQFENVGIFIIIDRQFTTIDLTGRLVANLDCDLMSNQLKQRIVHKYPSLHRQTIRLTVFC